MATFPTGPLVVSKLKKLSRPMKDPEVVFLHCLLNYHLGPPDDQLPVEGPGAADFGPRTENKVKKFQKINKIDFGTKDFMDGIVGPHTWAVLNRQQEIRCGIVADPGLTLKPPTLAPPTFPALPGSSLPPSPVAIPMPKLVLDNIQIQGGEQTTVPFGPGGVTASHSLQVAAVVLNPANKDEVHPEVQFGPTIVFNRGPGAAGGSKTDLGFLAVLNVANLPLSGGRFTWSVQAQLALMKSVTNRSASGQLSGLLSANLSIVKVGNVDVLQVTTQLGVVAEGDPPGDDNGNKWRLKAGGLAFWGLTGTIGVY